MKKILEKSGFLTSAMLGFVLLIPLIILELINRWKFNGSFPIALFTFAWILQSIFIFLLIPIIKTVRARGSFRKTPINFTLRIVLLAIIAYIWSGWLTDQWPCLMGIPNCD